LQRENIVIPTFAEQRDPTIIPDKIKERLKKVAMQDVDPANLFRITWKNEPKEKGGLFNRGNWLEFPRELTGVKARIVGLAGKYFPVGAHKVGAAFACLVPRLVSGEFDPTSQKAVWPSTGNYCRGGAFDSALLGCKAIAILPQGMSKERFDWLRSIGTDEIIATPGTESNVKEIYDMCWKLRKERAHEVTIFNQFRRVRQCRLALHDDRRNRRRDLRTAQEAQLAPRRLYLRHRLGRTIAAGDYLRTISPHVKVVATEANAVPDAIFERLG